MALFRPASGGTKTRQRRIKLRGSLCDVLKDVSAQPLVFLDLAERSFMNWKPITSKVEFMDRHYLIDLLAQILDVAFHINTLTMYIRHIKIFQWTLSGTRRKTIGYR